MGTDSIGTWLGVGLTSAGFGITFWQLARTKSAANAAREAALAAQFRFVQTTLLILLTELVQLEEDISAGIQHGQEPRAVTSVAHWRRTASRAAGHIEILAKEERRFRTDLMNAIQYAGQAEVSFASRDSEFALAMRTAHASILAVTTQIHLFITRLQVYTEADDEA